MNYHAPHIITENNVKYELGTLCGREIQYEFKKMLVYLEVKGKILFGQKFKIYREDREIIYKLCLYFIRDKERCDQLGIDVNKGILLSGPVGCGKTCLMKLLKFMVPHQRPYAVIPSRNIVYAFNHVGYKIIGDYGDSQSFCFDDLGVEPSGVYFGKECNVIGEILLSRYELFMDHRLKTHATTNLNAKELEDRYGNRVRSRMRELFNLIGFDRRSKDKRT
ncbi:ATPase [Allomuricauda sp. NBRC 101325]|uniref:ATPase n=1 Tax=Allomuricauda sp. NBRC 101325 TaxID=1113758 RepID=UPI0024A19035|nr:ATPase [Muricauda sp. NBRC 101325]GLU45120.1 ATPase [Muricauda sp. NBRC 101325]